MHSCYVVHCISIARLWHQLRLSKFGPLSCICICPGSLQILTICAQIPPHGRWRHLDAGRPRVEPLVAKWKASPNPPDTKEICRRLIDLFLVSVLLDAGAGNSWSYLESQSGKSFSRSEGLGVASIAMFEEGFFSGNKENPHQVDGQCNKSEFGLS